MLLTEIEKLIVIYTQTHFSALQSGLQRLTPLSFGLRFLGKIIYLSPHPQWLWSFDAKADDGILVCVRTSHQYVRLIYQSGCRYIFDCWSTESILEQREFIWTHHVWILLKGNQLLLFNGILTKLQGMSSCALVRRINIILFSFFKNRAPLMEYMNSVSDLYTVPFMLL
jgi:hypothetical protein